MCTIGAMISGDKTFLLKNFDFRSTPTGWAYLQTFEEKYPHFALVDHAQAGLNSGLNSAGLGLLISRSRCGDPTTPEREERRTVLNGEVLAGYADVESAVAHIEAYAQLHPEMFGGNVLLADEDRISVTEYFGGNARSEIREKGFLLRANHSVFGLIDNRGESSLSRYDQMAAFLSDRCQRLADLDREDIIAQCKALLLTPPVLNPNTRSSFVIDIQDRRVDYRVGVAPWQTFRFTVS